MVSVVGSLLLSSTKAQNVYTTQWQYSKNCVQFKEACMMVSGVGESSCFEHRKLQRLRKMTPSERNTVL